MTGTAPWPHRQRVLRALGVVPYVLRRRDDGGIVPVPDAARAAAPERGYASAADIADARCVLVLPATSSPRARAVLERAADSFGSVFAPRFFVDVAAGEPSRSVPAAAFYLAFGEAQAHALGRSLPAPVMAQAEVVLLDLPQTLLQADGKRRLWQALGRLRRQFAAHEG